jgi:hypothetical protein
MRLRFRQFVLVESELFLTVPANLALFIFARPLARSFAIQTGSNFFLAV